MMHVLAISDLHGYLPEIPKCDLLLLGGDYCPTRNLDQERRFMGGEFTNWLKKIPARYIVGIGGNHDFILQEDHEFAKSLPWFYLKDEEVNLEGIRIYGTPWTPMFFNWAFMAQESELRNKFDKIPPKLDIVLSHGPAYRHLDRTVNGVCCGSFSLLDKLKEVKPDSHVFGHIHEERGILDGEHTRCYNVSHVNVRYEPRHGVMNIPLRSEE